MSEAEGASSLPALPIRRGNLAPVESLGDSDPAVLADPRGQGKVFSNGRVRSVGKPRRRILVVVDEVAISMAVCLSLRHAGYDAITEPVDKKVPSAAHSRPDLVILDQMVSDLVIRNVLAGIRSDDSYAPALFLTERGSSPSRVGGFIVGANDHLAKPFALAELTARVHAMMRRIGAEPTSDVVLRFADIELDESSREVRRSGTPVPLTATEFNLLRFFLFNPRRVLSKAEILRHVWRYDFDGCANVVPVCVGSLRKKLIVAGPPVIDTVRLLGYALR